MKTAAACLLALVSWQEPRVQPLRDALLFGGLDRPNIEAITDPAAAARWTEVLRRAQRFMSRLRPPPSHSGEMSMVWGKRRHYERLFAAAAVPYYATERDELAVAEEVADFVEGMRPCYEWEGFSECPRREAAFADFWMEYHPHSSFEAFLPLFAGNRWLCAADGFDGEKEPAKAADARTRAAALLQRAKAGEDPLFRYAAAQMLADPKCFVSPY
jgi:hypothetical protein